MCKLFPVLWPQRTCCLVRLLRDMHVSLGLQGRALVPAVEHGAWAFVAELTAVFVLSPEPREPLLRSNASRNQLDQPSNLPETSSGQMAAQKKWPFGIAPVC